MEQTDLTVDQIKVKKLAVQAKIKAACITFAEETGLNLEFSGGAEHKGGRVSYWSKTKVQNPFN